MIEAKIFAEWLQTTLAETESRPSGAFSFSVRSLSNPYVDKAPEDESGKRVLPVIIQTAPSQYEAYPTAKIYSQEFSCQFLFPLKSLNDIWPFFDWLSLKIVGKTILVGEEYFAMNAGAPQMGQVISADVAEQDESLPLIFKRSFVRKNEKWAAVSISVFLGTADKMNKDGGLVFGNQIVYTAKITTDSSAIVVETLEKVVGSSSKGSSLDQAQEMGGLISKATEASTSHGLSLTVFERLDPFWKQILDWYNHGTLQGKRIGITKTYYAEGAPILSYYLTDSEGINPNKILNRKFVINGDEGAVIQSGSEVEEMGKTVCFTFVFAPSVKAKTV